MVFPFLHSAASVTRKLIFWLGGLCLNAEQANQIENLIDGILLQVGQDAKVVRWCLNALAQFGRLKRSQPYVETALATYVGDPEIEAAGVAALCHMFRGSVQDIDALRTLDPLVWKLAALQNTDPSKIDVGGIKVDVRPNLQCFA